jgi:hypothetical protein
MHPRQGATQPCLGRWRPGVANRQQGAANPAEARRSVSRLPLSSAPHRTIGPHPALTSPDASVALPSSAHRRSSTRRDPSSYRPHRSLRLVSPALVSRRSRQRRPPQLTSTVAIGSADCFTSTACQPARDLRTLHVQSTTVAKSSVATSRLERSRWRGGRRATR